jgi:osmotically-inducible protein OsmY
LIIGYRSATGLKVHHPKGGRGLAERNPLAWFVAWEQASNVGLENRARLYTIFFFRTDVMQCCRKTIKEGVKMPEFRMKGPPHTAAYADVEDQHLAERVERALYARGYGALHSVRVSVRSRVVCLEGPVPSYYLKQLAQETARAVPGAHQIRNDLHVVGQQATFPEAGVVQSTSLSPSPT